MNVSGETLFKSRFVTCVILCAFAPIDPPRARADETLPTSLNSSLPSEAFAASRFTDPDIRFHRQRQNYSKPIEHYKLASTEDVFIEILPEETVPFAKSYDGGYNKEQLQPPYEALSAPITEAARE